MYEREAPTSTAERTSALPRSRWVLPLLVALAASGCYEQVLIPNEDDGRISIVNDANALDGRVAYPASDVPIVQPPSLAFPPGLMALEAAPGPALAPSSIDLTLLAEVLPPTVNGEVLQASSVWDTRNDRAIISYNVRGNVALGGLDYFTNLRSRRPRLRSSLSFDESDVSAVFVDGRYAYAATATQDVSMAAPAVLERIRVRRDRFRIDPGNARIALSSFAGTSTAATRHEIYATSGDGGAAYAFDEGDMSLLGEFALDDARWVAWDEDNGRVVVLQGTPGRISVFEEGSFPGGSMVLINSFPFPGADVPESKSTVEVVNGLAFIAAGPEGVQIMCLDDGQIVGSVPRPDPAALGLDPSVVVTNAVTVDDDLLFISNGEAGVYAAAGHQDFDQGSCTEPRPISMLGRLQFDQLQSVNHVVFRRNRLFVAAGLGGIKIVEVDVTP